MNHCDTTEPVECDEAASPMPRHRLRVIGDRLEIDGQVLHPDSWRMSGAGGGRAHVSLEFLAEIVERGPEPEPEPDPDDTLPPLVVNVSVDVEGAVKKALSDHLRDEARKAAFDKAAFYKAAFCSPYSTYSR